MSHTARSPSLSADLRALPRAFWVLFAGTFINRFGTFVWPFLTIYLTRQSYSMTAASWAVSAFSCGALCGGLMGGWLADHFGRSRTIVLGTFSSAVAFMLLYAAGSFPIILFCTAMAGLTCGIYHPAINALFADLVPAHLRVRGSAALRLAGNAGFACGAASGGALANYSFFWLFAGDALTTAAYGCIALLWLPAGLRTVRNRKAPWNEALRDMIANREFHGLWVAVFLSAMIYSQFASTYSLQVMELGVKIDFLGWKAGPELVYGFLVGWNGLFIVLAELPLTSATLRYAPRRVMALGYLLVGAGFAMNAFAHSILELWVVMSVFTLGEMISAPMVSASVARFAPERMRGRYMGMLGLAWSSAGILGPLIGFQLFALNPILIWILCGVLGVGATLAILRKPGEAMDSEQEEMVS